MANKLFGKIYLEVSKIKEKTLFLKAIINVIISVLIIIIITLVGVFFRETGFAESNVIIIYIIGVLLVSTQTDGYFYGVLSSVLGVLCFNYFFTEPYYTFRVHRDDYPVTFLIMLIAALIASGLTAKIKKECAISSRKERETQLLYQINKNLLKIRTMEQIATEGSRDIGLLINEKVIIVIGNPEEKNFFCKIEGEEYDNTLSEYEKNRIKDIYNKKEAYNEPIKKSTGISNYYMPITGQRDMLGIIGIVSEDKIISNEKIKILEAVSTQVALAIERELIWEEKQKAKTDIEKERMKGNMLRAVSHDLRTPLTSILGATTTILDNYSMLEGETVRELLGNIYSDTSWIIHTVENILYITRMDDGKIEINKTLEAVEEIIGEAVARTRILVNQHPIKISIPKELVFLPMDGSLIEQVLINLIDNAAKYSEPFAPIDIKFEMNKEDGVFEVSDYGIGLPKENVDKLFERFYIGDSKNYEGRRGTGLGLAICKAIITAHGGEISAFNKKDGGATFRFVLRGVIEKDE